MIQKVLISLIVVVVIVGLLFIGFKLLFGNSTTVDPISIKGEKLMATDDINPIGDQNFSVSPTGNLITYLSHMGDPFQPLYILYDVKKQERKEIGLSLKAKELSEEVRGPLAKAGCWNSQGTQVYFPGDSILFVVDVTSDPLEMQVLEKVDKQEFLNYYQCQNPSDDLTTIRILTVSDREAQLVDPQNPQRVFAAHKVRALSVNRIEILYLVVSPDEKWVSYVVDQYRGSFVAPSQGYILRLDKSGIPKPQLLAAPVFGPLRWSPDSSEVYATSDGSQGKGIYRWRI